MRHGDICSEEVHAIVNPANEAMRHRGGVAKVIADKAGGGIVQRESDEWISRHGPLTTGERVAVTRAGALPCTYVVHVAGPVHKAATARSEPSAQRSILVPQPRYVCRSV